MAWSDWNPLNLLKPKPTVPVVSAPVPAPLSGEPPAVAGRRRRRRVTAGRKRNGRRTHRARK